MPDPQSSATSTEQASTAPQGQAAASVPGAEQEEGAIKTPTTPEEYKAIVAEFTRKSQALAEAKREIEQLKQPARELLPPETLPPFMEGASKEQIAQWKQVEGHYKSLIANAVGEVKSRLAVDQARTVLPGFKEVEPKVRDLAKRLASGQVTQEEFLEIAYKATTAEQQRQLGAQEALEAAKKSQQSSSLEQGGAAPASNPVSGKSKKIKDYWIQSKKELGEAPLV